MTEGIRFDTGVSTTDWTTGVIGQTPGQTQMPLLPGSTTVSEALKDIFPNESVESEIMGALAKAGSSPVLRSSIGFRSAVEKSIGALKGKKSAACDAAAAELARLLDDTELLEQYRAALLES